MSAENQAGTVETRVPARLDRLPWSRFHCIGGEYAATDSAIDELIPARVRGRVDPIGKRSRRRGADRKATCGYRYRCLDGGVAVALHGSD